MDWARHAMVNHMLDKDPQAAAIEVGPAGAALSVEAGEIQLSFAGPGFTLQIDNENMSGPVRFMLKAGQILELIPRAGAMWAYLGVQGDFDLPPLLGSFAENSVSGLYVEKLSAGSRLAVSAKPARKPTIQMYIDPYIALEDQPLGMMPSSQFESFLPGVRESLADRPVSITPRFDRMAYQLSGVRLKCDKGHDILSDGVTMGAVQIPGDGRPFILMADHQPTGGYPKIACICKVDLPRIAQMAPGKLFTLRWITRDHGLERWVSMKKQIETLTALRGI
jgi:allophanate hydrolase subunit 2